MNRQEFFRRLEYLLRGIPESERMDALQYYNDYFDDAGAGNEEQVIRELGSPEAVAEMILEDYQRGRRDAYADYGSPEMEYGSSYREEEYGERSSYEGHGTPDCYEPEHKEHASWFDRIKNMNRMAKIWAIVLLILTFPIWIGIVAGVFGGLFGIIAGLFGGLFGVVAGVGGSGIGILAGGLVCLVVGIIRLFTSPIEGVVTIGIGALLTAVSMLLVLVFVLLLFQWIPALVRTIVKWIKNIGDSRRGGGEI